MESQHTERKHASLPALGDVCVLHALSSLDWGSTYLMHLLKTILSSPTAVHCLLSLVLSGEDFKELTASLFRHHQQKYLLFSACPHPWFESGVKNLKAMLIKSCMEGLWVFIFQVCDIHI